MKSVLITGAAGFIGFHLSKRLINDGFRVFGIDNLNEYYDIDLKKARLAELKACPNYQNFSFHKIDICDEDNLTSFFKKEDFDCVINLAAQAGVRYSITHPQSYLDSNLKGFGNILEACRHKKIQHLIFASSSSVYGMNTNIPFSTRDVTDFPISLYAATKKSNEVMALSYSHLYDMPITGLRFFTVYGPFGRPDMAYFKFTEAILKNKKIDVFNNGEMKRDFTYVDDVVESISKIISKPPKNSSIPHTKITPKYKMYNVGNNNPVSLMSFIKIIEQECQKNADINFLPMQSGDVIETYANIDDLKSDFDYSPSTPVSEGINKFVSWYKRYKDME